MGKEGFTYKSASSNLSRANLSSGLQPQQEPGKGQECESEAPEGHVTALRRDLGKRLVPVPKASLAHRGWLVLRRLRRLLGHGQGSRLEWELCIVASRFVTHQPAEARPSL